MYRFSVLLLLLVAPNALSIEVETAARFYTKFGPQISISTYIESWKLSLTATQIKQDGLISYVEPDGSINYDETVTRYDLDSNFIGIKANKFLFENSFYTSAELQYSIEGKANATTTYFDDDSKRNLSMKYRTAFVGFSLGNNWKWENFSIDWSWLSYERYLFHNLNNKNFTRSDRDVFHKERGMGLISKFAVGVIL